VARLNTKRVPAVAAAAVLLGALFWFGARTAMADFEVNYKAGGRLFSGETLYRTEDAHWQFKYSPFSALVYLPLSFLPLEAAKGVWFLVVAAAIASVIGFSAKIMGASGPRGRAAVVLATAIMARFLLRELQLGQINAVITAILLFMVLHMKRSPGSSGGGARTGTLWGLASAMKPYALIFLPYFVARRKFRPLASGLAVIAASLVVPAVFYGIRGSVTVLREWAESLSRSTPALFATQDNVSLMGFLVKWTGDVSLSSILLGTATALLAVVTLAAVLAGKRVDDPLPLDAALLLLYIPLLSPLGWDYTFLSSFPAVLLLVRLWNRFPPLGRAALAVNAAMIGLTVYDLLGRKLYAAVMAHSVPTFNFLAVAAALLYLRLKRAA
jgi:alpha-1,2-mannosyltransferase